MKKILIIDDEKPTLAMLSLLLEALGYEALTADNAETALEIFSKERPSIVLTDIKMPGKDGLAALKQIKEIDANAQVIVITGHGDKNLASKAYDLGAISFLHKPLDTNELTVALELAEKAL
jgi:DNA-binding NtrC family response regulator